MIAFLAIIKNKELDFGSRYNLARWHEFLKANEGKEVRITKPERKRTLSQNRYYWVYLEIVARETGNLAEDLHTFFKQKLLPRKFIKIKGKKGNYEIEDYKSTTELSKLEMGEYLDKIASATEVPLPDPRDAGYYK